MQYTYHAYTPAGEEKRGRVDADSVDIARQKLVDKGLYVASMEKTNRATSGGAPPLSVFTRVGKKELALFFRQLSVMLRAGVTIVHALTVLQRQSFGRGMTGVTTYLLSSLESGSSLSESMKESRRFSLYDVSMVASAEESGELDQICCILADQMEKRHAFKAQFITGMIYPAVVTLFSVVVIIILSVFVVPQFAEILGGQEGLPALTRSLMIFSEWMQEYWGAILLGIFGTLFGVPLIKKTREGSYFIDSVALHMPLISKLVRSAVLVQFSRNMSVLLRSGVPLSDGLLTVRDTLGNAVAAQHISTVHEQVITGDSMAETMRTIPRIFPPMLVEMVATGEETGSMDEVLILCSEIYEQQMDQAVKRMNALLEPLLILIIGGLVGYVVIALITGVLSLY
ncbi:type II secretion system F family protein [Chitinivibrio alkaliphilus]|uniref:Type IV pilus biogenesis protein PilC n=1 Tax=Chitinivibrio alkaliphilus ACht1 TaxID=1313304 RepID=U7D820_9BACT|nr:type II secretion system F family protein [Chitinivibrio alkaliphilus]ERP31232.1 type IV pilus biogenesis protein PilC [Chitinivibrio alkaliphilus ACht1]